MEIFILEFYIFFKYLTNKWLVLSLCKICAKSAECTQLKVSKCSISVRFWRKISRVFVGTALKSAEIDFMRTFST